MKLRITSAPHCNREELRTLLIDAADELAGGNSCLLEAKLPWDGHPILLADAEGHPVLVSFDLADSQAALVSGLHATDQLAVALPWVNQVYAPLQQRQKAPRLVVVSSEPPPGSEAVLRTRSGAGLTMFSCRVLSVNGDMGILLEPLDGAPVARAAVTRLAHATQPAVPEVAPPAPRATESVPSLSDEERAYFQQL
ncbi:MAG: hypothetical protein WAL92_17825 [Thiogranum sp.]